MPTEALHLTPLAGLIVNDGRPAKVDVKKAVRDSNALQQTLLEETGASRFVRQTRRWNWLD